MSAKAVREHHGKKLLAKYVKELSKGKHVIDDRSLLITGSALARTSARRGGGGGGAADDDTEGEYDFDAAVIESGSQWVYTTPLVVKPDQLIKRRGKAGLVGIQLDWTEVKKWITERMEKEIQVEQVRGELNTFIVEPFVPHSMEDEYYICIQSDREGEEILFYSQGGVDVGDVDTKARRLHLPINDTITEQAILDVQLLEGIPTGRIEMLTSFIVTLFTAYRMLNFTYMEINPIVFSQDGSTIVPLDLAAKIDETASFLNASQWGHLDFPPPFGRKEYPEEAYIRELDGKTGASLKLTILNPAGRIWTMVRWLLLKLLFVVVCCRCVVMVMDMIPSIVVRTNFLCFVSLHFKLILTLNPFIIRHSL
jgi:ATP citrate (pro-S)-lyase